MVEIRGVYQGQKRCELTHGPSSSKIETDAPTDNMGRGQLFSPTDLVAAALSSCVMTTIAILCEKQKLPVKIDQAQFKITKEMTPPPRKIAALKMVITMPLGIKIEFREKIQKMAESCPVKLSLDPSIQTPLEINYPD